MEEEGVNILLQNIDPANFTKFLNPSLLGNFGAIANKNT